MASKAGTGMRVRIEDIHLREAGMEPFEIMISESQERMLAVVDPAHVEEVLAVCKRWGLEARVIGEVTAKDRLEIVQGGEAIADAPVHALAEEGPVYERPIDRPEWIDAMQAGPVGDAPAADLEAAYRQVLASPNVASKRWVWEQYDHMIFLGTVGGPGGDAAVIRIPGHDVAVALTTDGPGRYCYLDPFDGARLAVAEAARNVACTGAKPLAVTNCLNFGNPEKPEVMWQFSETVRGISDACSGLGTPVTGGNVSFYNETKGRPIYPTPVIGMLGSLERADRAVGSAFVDDGDAIVLLGTTRDHDLGGSEYAKAVHGIVGGRPPQLNLGTERRLIELLVKAAMGGLLRSAHDPAGGGLAVALSESAIYGGRGFSVDLGAGEPHRTLFSESPSRAVVSCAPDGLDALLAAASDSGVPATVVGRVGGDRLDFGTFSVSLEDAKTLYETSLPALMDASSMSST